MSDRPPSPRGPLSISDRGSFPTTRSTRQPRENITRQQRQAPTTEDERENELLTRIRQENNMLKRLVQSQKKNFSTHNVSDNMSYRYLHIDSTHLEHIRSHEYEYKVNLLEPIRNATHMELTSFSIANDFYNVIEENNDFRMIFKRTPTVGTTQLNDVYVLELSLDKGFYTHQELITALIAQINLSANGYNPQAVDADGYIEFFPKVISGTTPIATQTTYSLKIKMTAETSGKTLIQIKPITTPVSEPLGYGMLSYPYELHDEYFSDSILHRLGYTKYQVYFSDENITDSTSAFLSNATSANRISLVNQSIIDPNITSSDLAISSTVLTGFVRYFVNSATRDIRSNKLAWETHAGLTLTCDLIHDIQETTNRYKKLGKTEMSDTLCQIPITVNRASWVNYIPNPQTHLHKIDNPLIRNFRLGVKNPHNNRHFKGDEHKPFQITLKIHTMDDESIANREFFNSIAQGMKNFSYRD